MGSKGLRSSTTAGVSKSVGIEEESHRVSLLTLRKNGGISKCATGLM